MTTPPERRLAPSFKTLRKSRGERSGSISGSETLPALETARLEGGATGPSLHAMTEAVTALPTSNLWLVSPFHGLCFFEGAEERTTGYERRGSYVKVRPRQKPCPLPAGPAQVREEFGWVAKRTGACFDGLGS
jgi:hypothetical protein